MKFQKNYIKQQMQPAAGTEGAAESETAESTDGEAKKELFMMQTTKLMKKITRKKTAIKKKIGKR